MSEFEVISNSFEMEEILFCSKCKMVLEPTCEENSIIINNNLSYHTECFNFLSEEDDDNNEELNNINRLPASLSGKKGRTLKVRRQRGQDPALIAQIENLNFDIFQRRSLFLTLSDVKTVARQLGYLPYNIVEIGAYEHHQFQDGIIDSRERISCCNNNTHHIAYESLHDFISNEKVLPLVIILYPLNANDLQGRYNLKEGSKPFPTITWMSCPNLSSKISKLEEAGWIEKFQNRLSDVNEVNKEYRERMRNAHKLYSETRWNLLTTEDKEMIEKEGWGQNLRDIGIAGMANYEAVKCLHTHYAHFLAYPKHGNIIGEWVHELLIEERDKNFDSKIKKDSNIIQIDRDITEISISIESLNINSEKNQSNLTLTPVKSNIKDSSDIENNKTPISYSSPPSKVDYSSPPSKAVNNPVDAINLITNTFSPKSSGLKRLDIPYNDNLEDLKEAVLNACIETTAALNYTEDEFDVKFKIHRNISSKKLNEEDLRKFLKHNPSLCCYRTVEMGTNNTGHTPMHICAGLSNIKAMEILIEFGASTWVRDLQGRTPLHIAAEKNQILACEFLRKEMMLERKKDPIGENAPTDLKGTTPLGCASIKTKGNASPAIRKLLYNVGDNSILPRSPRSPRAGKSPWKGPLGTISENLIYAHAETNGWKESMEDRISIANPVIGRSAWSFFGIFDGHGGQYTANFLADKFPIMLSNEANRNEAIRNKHDFSSLLGGKDNDEDTTPEILEEILLNTCYNVEEKLSREDRMLIDYDIKKSEMYEDIHSRKHKCFTCYDTSGSAAIISLVTSRYVAIGNIGDSRAVLGHRVELKNSTNISNSIYTNHHKLMATDLSRDHKLNIPEELQRAQDAGCIVNDIEGSPLFNKEVYSKCYKDTSRLRMSRSFGDFYLKQNIHLPHDKQAVIAVPEIRIHERKSSDAFVVLACDGIWDVMSSQDVINFLGDKLGYTESDLPSGGITAEQAVQACDELLELCMSIEAYDNLSVIIIILGDPGKHIISMSSRSSLEEQDDKDPNTIKRSLFN